VTNWSLSGQNLEWTDAKIARVTNGSPELGRQRRFRSPRPLDQLERNETVDGRRLRSSRARERRARNVLGTPPRP
jgi:hypothetical protein